MSEILKSQSHRGLDIRMLTQRMRYSMRMRTIRKMTCSVRTKTPCETHIICITFLFSPNTRTPSSNKGIRSETSPPTSSSTKPKSTPSNKKRSTPTMKSHESTTLASSRTASQQAKTSLKPFTVKTIIQNQTPAD